jgi:hypothetical protein
MTSAGPPKRPFGADTAIADVPLCACKSSQQQEIGAWHEIRYLDGQEN